MSLASLPPATCSVGVVGSRRTDQLEGRNPPVCRAWPTHCWSAAVCSKSSCLIFLFAHVASAQQTNAQVLFLRAGACLQILGWLFALQPQFSDGFKKVVHLQFSSFFLVRLRVTVVPALHKSRLKPASLCPSDREHILAQKCQYRELILRDKWESAKGITLLIKSDNSGESETVHMFNVNKRPERSYLAQLCI